jgi:hypothetical protein
MVEWGGLFVPKLSICDDGVFRLVHDRVDFSGLLF